MKHFVMEVAKGVAIRLAVLIIVGVVLWFIS